MPRILGVDLPNDKPTHISLRYIYGIGPTHGAASCASKAGIDPQRRAKELTDDEIARIADASSTASTRSKARCAGRSSRTSPGCSDIGCYRGLRHRRGLPVRGQRTRTNARTRKGPRKTVAGKKGVKEMRG